MNGLVAVVLDIWREALCKKARATFIDQLDARLGLAFSVFSIDGNPSVAISRNGASVSEEEASEVIRRYTPVARRREELQACAYV